MQSEKIKHRLLFVWVTTVTIFSFTNIVAAAEKVVVIPLMSDTTSSSECIDCDNNGNVGIGTTDPTSKLHVFGSANADRNGIINVNVVSGDPNPSQAIAIRAHIEGNPSDTNGQYDAFTAIDVNNGGGSADYYAFRVESGYTTAMQIQSGTIDYITGIDLTFNNDSADVLTLKSNGDIGIGTTNPGSKLSVVGLPSGTNDSVVNGTLAGALCITDTGNLYIDIDGTCAN